MSTRVHVNGLISDGKAAVISVFDRGFLYGDSVYEVLRTSGGRPVDLDRHLARLARSAAAIELSTPDPSEIRAAIADTLAEAGNDESYLRIMITRGAGPMTLAISPEDRPSLLVFVSPLQPPDPALYQRGAALAVVGIERTSRRSVDPAIKSGNRLNNIMALAEARRVGAYEALMCDQDGRIAEGSTSNVFAVRGDRLVTPALATGLLPGITRQRIMELAREAGLDAAEGDLRPDDLRAADEVFITSSIRGVMPVATVDGVAIGVGAPGPVTRRLTDLYARFVAGVAAPTRLR